MTVTKPAPMFIARWLECSSNIIAVISGREAIASQHESTERLHWTLQTGGLLWDPISGCYTDRLAGDLDSVIRKPHIVGITRELEGARQGTWVGTLFDYQPPRLGLRPSEQKLLLAALDAESGTDLELASALDLSVPTVKKTWLGIYRRVSERQPEILGQAAEFDGEASERGKEKRRRLLAYLREHAEELRPLDPHVCRSRSGRLSPAL